MGDAVLEMDDIVALGELRKVQELVDLGPPGRGPGPAAGLLGRWRPKISVSVTATSLGAPRSGRPLD